MAEEKKGGAEEGGGGGGFSDVLFWILFLGALWLVVKYLLNLVGIRLNELPSFSSVFVAIFDVIQVASIFLCLLFLLGTLYANFKLGQLSHHGHGGHHDNHTSHGSGGHHHSSDHHGVQESGHTTQGSANQSKKRWENITLRIKSHNEADWRLAIIECDILLDEMLKKMGYPGESIADKLKIVEPSDFHTLNEAWEAHKVRNRIAHSGTDFHLSRSEAERVFALYKKVFEEFYFV